MAIDRKELTIIQKMYDLILWFVPMIERLPRSHRYTLGARIENGLYGILEELIIVKYAKEKIDRLTLLNAKLDVLRYQTRLLVGLKMIEPKKLAFATELINGVGVELGGWIKQQRRKQNI